MRSVILIDDEVFARKGLCSLIPWNDHGYQIVGEASDGEEGLELIERLQPDLVITDIRMPVVDGLELIRSAKEKNLTRSKFILITGYNDFSYAQQALRFEVDDLLLKPIDEDELTETLRRVSSKWEKAAVPAENENRRALLLERLLQGKAEESTAQEAARLFGFTRDAEFRYVIVERNDASSETEEEAALALEGWKRSAADFLAALGQGDPPMPFQTHNPYAFGFLADSGRLRAYAGSWERFAEGLVRHVSKAAADSSAVPRVYLGHSVRSAKDAAMSYRSVFESLPHKFALADQTVIFSEKTGSMPLQYRDLDPKWTDVFMESLEEHDVNAAHEAVSHMFAEFRDLRFAPESIHACISRFALGVAETIGKMEGNEAEVESLLGVLHWNKRPMTLSGLRRVFEDFVRDGSDYMASLRKDKAKGGISKVKLYIETHFRENISLKSIAKQFYMNPVYLGQLFRKTYNVYFNDYLLNIRIQEAKRLLRQTDCKVYEVAAKVGFSNPDYFVTQFEKVERKTPMEYKNSLIARS
ncbi:response regulator transcription factor [Cohnella candidum]|uniref:DNA-binding response regulator n=1 Tax=Cohnella candidum TaxID=2674991 RepID=A0A3G3K1L6_9BACL|nr:response regulator transcription factor [Cohnella candidum]AYQ73947.1 DNA-binding response regulator [Cohnella candidum]